MDLASRTISVKNWVRFIINLKDIAAGRWVLKADGQEVQSGDLPDLDLAPGASKQITIPVQPFEPQAGVEYFLEITFTLKHDMLWAAAPPMKSRGTNSNCRTLHPPRQ